MRRSGKKEDEPARQRTVTNHQINELTEFLVELVGRAQKGELYKIDGYAPTDFTNVITVDSGLVRIAMSECLESRGTAISATRDVIWGATKLIAPNAIAGKCKDDVPLDVQEEFLAIVGGSFARCPLLPQALQRPTYSLISRKERVTRKIVGLLELLQLN